MIAGKNTIEKKISVAKPTFWNNAKRYYDLKSYWINRFGCRNRPGAGNARQLAGESVRRNGMIGIVDYRAGNPTGVARPADTVNYIRMAKSVGFCYK